jgi:ribosomal protein S18 acetylase RimI-like enzyme
MNFNKAYRQSEGQSSQLSAMTAGLDAQATVCANRSLSVERLAGEHRAEALSFLAERAVHTVYMAGLIRDNGVVSPLNRGTFYACRNAQGILEGVALIGHATLVEARTEAALSSFANFAQGCSLSHLIHGLPAEVESFWRSYAPQSNRTMRRLCREMLFEHRGPVKPLEAVKGLRQATLADLALVMMVNAGLRAEECGVSPLERDALGFRQRTARRIEQGRVWVWAEQGQLIFKADIVADTPEAVYLEGVYVHPQERRKGYGLRCITQLSRCLLARTEVVCLIVNERQEEAQAFYRRAGYKHTSDYDTIYLQQLH